MIAVVSGALAPSIAILSFIYLKDKYELEPIKLIIKMFILGLFLVFPAYVFEKMFQEAFANLGWYHTIFSIAIIEEFLKWFVLYFLIFKHVEFNEPYDGVVYSVTVAIGFATLENIGYLIFYPFQPSLVLLRAFLPVSGHAIFGILMGYFFGRAKFSNKSNNNFLMLSLIIPILSHSLFNFILGQSYTKWFYLMIPFLIFMWRYVLNRMKIAASLSPFKSTEV